MNDYSGVLYVLCALYIHINIINTYSVILTFPGRAVRRLKNRQSVEGLR